MDSFIKGVVDSYTNYNDLEEFAALIDIDNDEYVKQNVKNYSI